MSVLVFKIFKVYKTYFQKFIINTFNIRFTKVSMVLFKTIQVRIIKDNKGRWRGSISRSGVRLLFQRHSNRFLTAFKTNELDLEAMSLPGGCRPGGIKPKPARAVNLLRQRVAQSRTSAVVP